MNIVTRVANIMHVVFVNHTKHHHNLTNFHVGKVKTIGQPPPVNKWHMAYPNEILSLQIKE